MVYACVINLILQIKIFKLNLSLKCLICTKWEILPCMSVCHQWDSGILKACCQKQHMHMLSLLCWFSEKTHTIHVMCYAHYGNKHPIYFTGACGQDTASPLFTPYPPFFKKKFHSISVDWCNQKTAYYCSFTYF